MAALIQLSLQPDAKTISLVAEHHYGYVIIKLISCSVNVGCGPAEERVLLTGLHAVADIYCECCKTTLGWKYVSITFLLLKI